MWSWARCDAAEPLTGGSSVAVSSATATTHSAGPVALDGAAGAAAGALAAGAEAGAEAEAAAGLEAAGGAGWAGAQAASSRAVTPSIVVSRLAVRNRLM